MTPVTALKDGEERSAAAEAGAVRDLFEGNARSDQLSGELYLQDPHVAHGADTGDASRRLSDAAAVQAEKRCCVVDAWWVFALAARAHEAPQRFNDRLIFASILATKGINSFVLRDLLGHTSTRTTERYARPNPETLAVVRQALA